MKTPKKLWLALSIFLVASSASMAQKKSTLNRPKLVVGIVIDQMRWDYLQRFYSLFGNGGFKRMMNDGFSCDNTFIPYTPTVTACGHTSIYTGSVPAIHGITSNTWRDRQLNRSVYCTEDKTVKTVGSTSNEGEMSPRNMLTTTIGDELRTATNFKSRVFALSIKDRGSILPGGHAANGVYWYDNSTGRFITSTYYTNELPAWVTTFNNRKMPDSLYTLGWKISRPAETYLQYATADDKPYETKTFGSDQKGFPYDLQRYIGKDYSKLNSTPHSNTFVSSFAKALMQNEQLGKGEATDMIAISFSAPDIIGHAFGPNSWETFDQYLRLDETLSDLFNYLDATIGKGQYVSFLTADHAVANIPGFSKENKLPGGTFDNNILLKNLNTLLLGKFNVDKLVTSMNASQVHFNHKLLDSLKLNEAQLKFTVIDYLEKVPEISRAFDLAALMTTTLPSKLKNMFANGWYPNRGGDVQFILKSGYVEGKINGTGHGGWNPYDSHIPLLWYGWNIKKGHSNREVYMIDIAPTLAAMLHIQMPSGCIGNVIEEVMK
jgi:predicted AlkP superfamily pyrophosphatase or phosphodiesterase